MGSTKIKLNPFTGKFDLVKKDTKNVADNLVFYRNCNVYEDTWLFINHTPSNVSGVGIKTSDLQISKACVRNKRDISFDIEIYEHDGNLLNSALLTTLNVTSDDESFTLTQALTEGKQVAMRAVNFSSDRPCDLKVEVLVEGL